MASDISKLAKTFSEAFRESRKSGTSAYDTQATVIRTEGSTAWVHIPGGVDETPVRMTLSAEPGDEVQVRIAGGRAWLTGNATAPPTDDRTAKAAKKVADSAQSSATAVSGRVAVIESAYISEARVETLLADYAQIDYLEANYATITELHTGYAQINLANIDTANISKASIRDIFTEVGLIASATIVDGKITGYLDAVNVNAANITAGTLVADRIAIRGSNSSLIYALNNYGQITSTQVNTLDGYVLTPRTINADKIVAGTITATEIAASTITANKLNVSTLSSVAADIGTVTAGVLKSTDYSYTSGTYTAAGMIIDLTNKVIRMPNTAILSNGAFYSKSGSIAGWTFSDTAFYRTSSTFGSSTGMYFGTSGLSLTDKFRVNASGTVYIENGIKVTELSERYIEFYASSLASGSATAVGFIGSFHASVGTMFYSENEAWLRSKNNQVIISANYDSATGTAANYGASAIILGATTVAVANHLEVLNDLIFTATTDKGIIQGYNSTTKYNILRNHGNGNVSLSACSAGLYLGYTNTTFVNFLNGLMSLNSQGNLTMTGSLILANNTYVYAKDPGGNQRILIGIGTGDTPPFIFGYGSRTGQVGASYFDGHVVYMRSNNGIYMQCTGASINAALTVTGTITGYDYSGASHVMVGSAADASHRVGYLYHQNPTTVRVYGQAGGSGYTTYTTLTGTSSSDIRLKEHIKGTEVNALHLIRQIEMRAFDWKPGWRDYTYQPIGMIADQIENLDHRLVIGGGYDPDGEPNYKVIDDHYLICYLTKAVQELSEEINALKGVA